MGPDEMRDRSVLRFEVADIEKVEVARGEKLLTIKRKGTEWKAPAGLEMESYEIDQFLWDLRRLKYKTIEPEEDDDSYGFNSPILTVKLWNSGKSDPLGLAVGKTIPRRDLYYLRGDDGTHIMEVEGTLISRWLDKF